MTGLDGRHESSLVFVSFVDPAMCNGLLGGGVRKQRTHNNTHVLQCSTQRSNVWEQFHITLLNLELNLGPYTSHLNISCRSPTVCDLQFEVMLEAAIHIVN